MSRRRASGPPISLFSFQDIITCVTAILIVITLLLALELVQTLSGPPASATRLASNLAEVAALLEAEREQLRSEVAGGERETASLAGTGRAELLERSAALERRLADLANRHRALRESAAALAAREAEALSRRAEQADQRRELERAENDLRALRERTRRLTAAGRPLYALPRGSRRFGWVLVLGPGGAELAPAGRSARPRPFVDGGTDRAESAALRQVAADSIDVSGGGRTTAYVLLLVRPGGVDRFDAARRTLDELGISWGFDLVGPDEVVLDAETGAWEE